MNGKARMKVAVGVALVVAAGWLASAGPASASPAGQGSGCHVWAYYMGFWTGTGAWEHQGGVLGDRPSRGYYSALDAGTAAAQIDEARSAGIEAFVVDWWGPRDGGTTGALDNLLGRAAERGFMVGASVDSFGGQNNVGRAAMTEALRSLVADKVHHPAYLRYRGKPVVFFAFQGGAGVSAEEWRAIRAEIDPSHDTIWVAEGTRSCPLCGLAMDGMYAFNMAWSDGKAWFYTRDRDVVAQSGGWLYVPTVNPGWDEAAVAARDGRPNPTSRRDRAGGAFLRSLWSGAAASGSDVRMVVSWNEFIENSHVEPSVNYGTSALDTLRELVAGGCTGGGGDGGAIGVAVAPAAVPGGDLVRAAEDRQAIQFNPSASLQSAVFRDGFVPNSGEFDTTAGGWTWRAQRAEHLASGRVRVYFAAVGDWGNVGYAERGSANYVHEALLADGERWQLIQFNPSASLQSAIFGDGFVPNSPEFRATVGGQEVAAQRAEHLRSGEVRVYHAPVTDYGNVRWVRR